MMNTQTDSAIEKLCMMLQAKPLRLQDDTVIMQRPNYVGPVARKYIETILAAFLGLEARVMSQDVEMGKLKAHIKTLEGMRGSK